MSRKIQVQNVYFFMSDEERMIHVIKMQRLRIKRPLIQVVGG